MITSTLSIWLNALSRPPNMLPQLPFALTIARYKNYVRCFHIWEALFPGGDFVQTIKKLLATCFALIAFSSFGALLYPIVLVHGLQLIPGSYGTWNDYATNLKTNLGYSLGGVWQATYTNGRPSGAICVEPCPAVAYANDVFIVKFTDGSELTFSEQGGELAAILAAINAKRVANAMQSAKFSLVTHSMGGLAARFYLQNLHSGVAPYAGDVAHLITVGTPHKGSPLARFCNLTNGAERVAAILELGGLTGDVLSIAPRLYSEICSSNSAISYLLPESPQLNVMHQATASGTSSGLSSIPLATSVQNSPHVLPSTVRYSEIVVRTDRVYCPNYTFVDLDTSNANSSSAYGTCNFVTTSADGDDVVTKYSQKFLPAVLNGTNLIPQVVTTPSIDPMISVAIRAERLNRLKVGHLREASSPVVQAELNALLGRDLAAVTTLPPTNALPLSVLLQGTFACKFGKAGCTAGSTVPVYFRYGTSPFQQFSNTKSLRVFADSFPLDKITGLMPFVLRDPKDEVNPPKVELHKSDISINSNSEFDYSHTVANLAAGSVIYYKACVAVAGVESCGAIQAYSLPVSGAAASLTLPAPMPLTPAAGTSSSALLPAFTWTEVVNASSYRVVVADQSATVASLMSTDGECATCLVNVVTNTTSASFPAASIIAGKTYYWRVKARNPEQYGNWSPTFSFTINTSTALPAPVLQSPSDGIVASTLTPDFAWSPVATATSYRLLISSSRADLNLTAEQSLCAGCVANVVLRETTYSLPPNPLVAGQTYYWRVKARSPTQYGQLSAVRSFTVVPQSCSYLLSPSPTLAVVATAGTASVAVSTQSGCVISITSSPPWLTSSSPSVADISGYATIGLNVQANTSAASRTAALTVNGRTINVSQAGTAPATSYTITVVQGANGTATPSGTTSYGANQQVTLTATPASGAYLFSGWKESGSFVSFNSTWTFNATQNRTITAEFIASRVSQNVQMNGADEYARWRVFPGPDAWSKNLEFVSLAPNQSYDLICSDTPYFYANPGKVTYGLGASYNGPFSCNYLPKSSGGALNLPIATQARVAVDSFNYLAKLSDGRVAVWGAACQAAPGNGQYVQFCDGVSSMLLPQVVPGLTGVSAVSAMNPNNGKLLAKLASGGWSSWKGYSNPKLSPSAELALQNVALVRGTLAVKADGTLWAISQDAVLSPVGGVTNAVDAAQAGAVIFALRKDGVVIAVNGGNVDTQMTGIDFDDYTNYVVQPRSPLAPLPSISRVVSIAATSSNMFAVKQDGTVWAWGYAGTGYGGTVRPNNTYRPVQLAGVSGAAAVSASYQTVYVLLADGRVVAWVGNSSGQLGRGTIGAEDGTPTIIPGLTNVVEIVAAINGVLAVKADGTVWSWGANYGYSPGNGVRATTQSIPVQVLCPKGFSGFLNLNSASSCSANSQFTVKVDKQAPTVPATVKLNGAAVALPFSGQFATGTPVTLESEYEPGNDSGFWNFVDGSYRSKIISLPTGVDSDIKLNGGSCVNQLSTFLTSNFNLNVYDFAAASSGDLLVMTAYVSNSSPTCHWKFNSTASWIRAVNGDGYGPGQYQIQVDPNPTNATRTASFYLADPVTFAMAARTVTQAASATKTTPDAFAFTSIGGYPINTQADGSTLISGINAPTPVSVTNGSHSVGCTGTYATAARTIANGQALCVRLMSAPTASTTVTLMTTVGGVSAPFNVSTATACNLNVSGTGTTNANDGLLVMRYLLGFRGSNLINGVTPVGAPTNYADLVIDRIGALPLDLDGNGFSDALTDGLMYHRLTAGLTGSAVTNGAIGLGASRADWAAIQAFVNPRCGTNF